MELAWTNDEAWHITASFLFLSIAFAFFHSFGTFALLYWSRRWRAVSPRHKTFYVVADITKAAVLLLCICAPAWWRACYAALVDGAWQDKAVVDAIRWIVVVYSATDAAQFATVKMGVWTLLHHSITSLFALYMCWAAEIDHISRALLWYGTCSTFAYLANAYKAIRVLYGPTKFMDDMRRLAWWAYMIELAINIPVHKLYIIRAVYEGSNWFALMCYAVMTYVLMRDDSGLLTFLGKPGTIPPAEKALSDENARIKPFKWCLPYGLDCAQRFLRLRRLETGFATDGKGEDPSSPTVA